MTTDILLTNLLKTYNLSEYAHVLSERPFNFFSRITTAVEGKKCIFMNSEKYTDKIDSSVSMIITTEKIAEKITEKVFDHQVGICVTDNPRGLFFELLSSYEKDNIADRFPTIIGNNCEISNTAIIAPYNVIIGDNVKIDDFVIIRPNSSIGNNTTIQSGSKIAEQDFNVYNFRGVTKQVFHSGKVVIGSNVLISPNTFIGQALYSYGVTSVGDNSFIGPSTCIGHNVDIKSNCEICGHSSVGGYSTVGSESTIYLGVMIANAITIGNNVTVNMGSVVVRNIQAGKTVFGNPAREIMHP